jgi:hypothetical protein
MLKFPIGSRILPFRQKNTKLISKQHFILNSKYFHILNNTYLLVNLLAASSCLKQFSNNQTWYSFLNLAGLTINVAVGWAIG